MRMVNLCPEGGIWPGLMERVQGVARGFPPDVVAAFQMTTADERKVKSETGPLTRKVTPSEPEVVTC